MSHLDSANIVPKWIVIPKNWGMVHANSCRSDMSWVCIFFADFDVHLRVPNILHVGEVRTVVCGLGTTFINAPRFQCPGGIRPSEVHVFGGRIATQIASMVEMRLFWLVTSSVLRANLLNSKCSCWLNIQIYDEVLNFPSFLLATTSRFMAEHRHFSWLNSKFFLGSPRYFFVAAWPPPGSTATSKPLWWRTTRPALRARRATGGPGRCRSWMSYEESNRCRAFFHGKFMGKWWTPGDFSWENAGSGDFSWENPWEKWRLNQAWMISVP